MASTRAREAGTAVWIDLSTPDLERTMSFYVRLLGWEYEEADTPMGTYVVASVDAGPVGGMMAQPAEDIDAGVPAAWTVFVGTDHLDTDVGAAPTLGGSVLQAPMPIPGDARIAVVVDPTGAVLGLMEAPASEAPMVWGAIGAACWVECLSRDVEASRAFHEHLLGWKAEEGAGGYQLFVLDGERVAGLMAMPPTLAPEVPSHWLTYFAVADVDASCVAAADLGGAVHEPTHEIDEGRFAVLSDPAGAVFAAFEPRR